MIKDFYARSAQEISKQNAIDDTRIKSLNCIRENSAPTPSAKLREQRGRAKV